MLFNLLTATEDKFRSVEVGEAALYALLGFAVVFVGIAFLIFVVWLIGKLMLKFNPAKVPKQAKPTPSPVVNETAESLAVADASSEISEETVAVITAALMVYYQRTNPQCEFTVKRIKRI